MKFHAAFLLLTAVALPGLAATCESLGKLELPGTTITTAESIAAGSFAPPAGQPIRDLPAFCRVAGAIKPTPDSDIRFEVWMPASGWNGKFQGIGNGGFAGSIGFGALGAALRRGFATASTDTGHRTGPGVDASWALGHPEKITDYGYRAIHETAEKAKALIKAFYGDPPKRSYFSSCSNGGRQALMEAQRFPADYDGIIAGAPANYMTHLFVSFEWNMQAAAADSPAYIPSSKLPAVEAAALAACDALDGVKDGVIDNPMRCKFDPSVLRCKGPESDSCLSAPQIGALKKIYAGPRTSRGEQVLPGFPPGGESGPGGWTPWITGKEPGKSMQSAFGSQFLTNMLYSDPQWDLRKFDLDRETKLADDRLGLALNAVDPDLRRFEQRGGKLILYHGWSDAAIPAGNTVNYYESVVSRMGAGEVSGFVRMYMVPGMEHCAGGAGPNPTGLDTAIERWVEQGIAPDSILATTRDGARSRPLCAYPAYAKWKGTGSTDDAANFTCVK